MHFHLPKPLHGWREFVGEVGIIVVGVLIALGAEQLIESVHSRAEVKQTRTALDAELAYNLAAFDGRMSIQPCVVRRLDELTSILDGQANRRIPLRHEVEGPLTVNLKFAVWDAATGEARSLIPLQPKLKYADLFDTLRHYEQLRDRESDYWAQLAELDFTTQLSPQEVKQAKKAIKRIQRVGKLLPAYSSFIQRSAEALGISPERDIDAPARSLMNKSRGTFCSPLI